MTKIQEAINQDKVASQKYVFTSEVSLSYPENSTGPEHGWPLKMTGFTELDSLHF